VGNLEGWELGRDVDFTVDELENCNVGREFDLHIGCVVGWDEGLINGCKVGDWEGCTDGWQVGR
jgi:hypothetical protein